MTEDEIEFSDSKRAAELFHPLDDPANLVALGRPDAGKLPGSGIGISAGLDRRLEPLDALTPARNERLAGNLPPERVGKPGRVELPEDSPVLNPLRIGETKLPGAVPRDERIKDQGKVVH